MRRFHFNLEKVLEWRKYREGETEIELGRAIAALTIIQNSLKENAAKHNQAAEERFAQTNIRDIQYYDLYVRRLESEKEKLLAEAARAALVIEEKRAVYLEASRDRKVLDKLREKREKEYRKTMLAGETKELDDIASLGLARNRAEK
ncbi:MAG: flagellar export protein FliJ [Treponema sp.]|jgi:flagellar FliJ protein|nr:flagellar export protein FliJ [Treponema sp.]